MAGSGGFVLILPPGLRFLEANMDSGTCSTGGGCSELEPFALRVMGDSMAPEFWDGCIIIVEPRLSAQSGEYVVIDYANDTIFRQFVVEDGRRFLKPLNTSFETVELTGPYQVRGVVVQRAGTRRAHHKRYE
jgi:SOS-response transcriptional repressor LexA